MKKKVEKTCPKLRRQKKFERFGKDELYRFLDDIPQKDIGSIHVGSNILNYLLNNDLAALALSELLSVTANPLP